jgi:23S rRNA-/tRNA-specific pseudouridylate synthase
MSANGAQQNKVQTRVFRGSSPCPLPKAVIQLWPAEFPTLSSAKKRIRKGLFSLNGTAEKAKCGAQVQPGDVVFYKVQGLCTRQQGYVDMYHVQPIPLKIAYLDSMLVVAVKPYGISVSNEKGASLRTGSTAASSSSLHQRLLLTLPDSTSSFPLRRPAVVHRLDKTTYGLVIAARTNPAARALGAAFQSSSSRDNKSVVCKRYRAIVHGTMTAPHGYIREALDGKTCESEWHVIQTVTILTQESNKMTVTLLDLVPHTGRFHQLRRHVARVHAPIVGDARHGWEAKDAALCAAVLGEGRTLVCMLAAVEITFLHPDCKQAVVDRMHGSEGDVGAAVVQQPIGDEGIASEEGSNAATLCAAVDQGKCRVEIDKGASYRLNERAGTLNVTVQMPSEMVELLRAGTVVTAGGDINNRTQTTEETA